MTWDGSVKLKVTWEGCQCPWSSPTQLPPSPWSWSTWYWITNHRYISIQVTWSVLTNRRPVLRSRDQYWPMTGQYSGHVTSIDQWQVSIQVTWPVLTNHLVAKVTRTLMIAPAVMATQFPGKCQQEDCKAFRILPVNIGISSPVFLKCKEI